MSRNDFEGINKKIEQIFLVFDVFDIFVPWGWIEEPKKYFWYQDGLWIFKLKMCF